MLNLRSSSVGPEKWIEAMVTVANSTNREYHISLIIVHANTINHWQNKHPNVMDWYIKYY